MNVKPKLIKLFLLCVTITTSNSLSIMNTRVRSPMFQKVSATASSTRSRNTSLSANNNDKKKVAIIGGGIAGLSCASHLASLHNSRFEPTVFDTGRLRPGGRCSSRLPGDKTKHRNENQNRILNSFVIDHAAQILTVNHNDNSGEYSEFVKQVQQWEKDDIVKEFPSGSVVEILKDLRGSNKNKNENQSSISRPFIRTVKTQSKMYYGVNGMGSIPAAIAYPKHQKDKTEESEPQFQIHQDVWISPSNGVKFIGSTKLPKWKVQTNGKNYGTYDAIVIAHNGKCADRLMSRTPAKALHSLLRTNFNANVQAWGGKKMTLNSIYSLSIAIKKDGSPLSNNGMLKEDVISAFIKNEPTLRFITCQTRKFGNNNDDTIEVWTILSSATFAKKHKGPQENLPNEKVQEVTDLMLEALGKSLGLQSGTLHQGMVLDSRLQLWGAAVPLNRWRWNDNNEKDGDENSKRVHSNNESPLMENGFVFDAEHGVGACGDWLLDPSIGGAWESGRRLSNWFQHAEDQSAGLPPDGGAFQVSKAATGSGIGNVR